MIGLWVLSPNLAGRPGLAAAVAATFAAGAWCIVNYWRCRHAHCIVTGTGWLALAGFASVEALLGRSLISGFEGVASLGVLGAGMLFEFGWYVASGTPVVGSRRTNLSAAAQVPLARQDVISRS